MLIALKLFIKGLTSKKKKKRVKNRLEGLNLQAFPAIGLPNSNF